MDHFCGWLIVSLAMGTFLMTVIVWNFTDMVERYDEWKFRRAINKTFNKAWRK
jgi:hypothetical protein